MTNKTVQIVQIVRSGQVHCMLADSLVRTILTYIKSHSAHLLLKSDVIKHHGPEPKRMTIKADSGRDMERAWCNDCGSGIWITIVGSDMTNLKAGTNRYLRSYLRTF